MSGSLSSPLNFPSLPVNSTSSGSSMADDSGIVIDPEDLKFSISWIFDGRSVPAQEVLSSVIDGIATVAPYETDAQCAYITGVSFSGNVVFHIGQSLDATLLCGQISKAYIYLSIVILKNRKFMEMDFTLRYDGKTIGTGHVLKMSVAGSHNRNSTARIATTS